MKLSFFIKYIKNIPFIRTLSMALDKDLANVLSHAKNYLFATLALKAAFIFAIPLLTRILTTEEYGIIALFNSYLGIAIILFPLYLYSAVGRYYYESTSDFEDFVGTSLVLSFGFYVLSIFIIVLLQYSVFDLENGGSLLFCFLLVVSGMKIVSTIYYLILIPKRMSRQTAKLQITEGYINILFSIILVLLLPSKKYFGPIIGIFISSFVILLYSSFKLIKLIKFNIRWSHVKYILLFSLPQLPYALSGIIMEQFGKIIVGKTKGYSDLGIYSLGFQVATIYILLTTAIRTALIPDFYKYMKSEEYTKITNLWRKIIMISMIPASFLMVFSREIIRLLAESSYYDSYLIVPVVVLGYVFFDLFYVYSPYLEYKKHTWVLSIIIVAGGILNIIIGYIFVSKIGYIGAGISFALVYCIVFILTWSILKLFYKLKIVGLYIIVKPVIAIIFLAGIVYVIDHYVVNAFISFILRSSIFITYIIIYIYKPFLNLSFKNN